MALSSVRFLLLLSLLSSWNLPAQTFQERLRTGLVALQRNDLAAAESSLRDAISLEPKNARAWVALAQAFWKLHKLDKAEEAAGKARKFAGNDSAVLRGLEIYDSESVAFYFGAAEPLLKKEQFGEVIAILSAAPASVLADSQTQLALGVADYGLRRFDEAAIAFLAVIARGPGVKQPYVCLGKMLDQVPSRLDAAAKSFIAFERNNPADFEGYLLHAKVLDVRGMEPSSPDAHCELGSLLEKVRHHPEAVHYSFSRLYRRNYFKLGAAFYWAGYPKLTLPYLQETIRANPANWKALLSIARLHQELSQNDQASDAYRQLLSVHGEYADALNQLGLIAAAKNQLTDARELFGQAIAAQRDHADTINNLGVLFAKMGKKHDSIAAFRYGIEKVPDHETVYLNLGRSISRWMTGSKRAPC